MTGVTDLAKRRRAKEEAAKRTVPHIFINRAVVTLAALAVAAAIAAVITIAWLA
jgi:hypothetical protein